MTPSTTRALVIKSKGSAAVETAPTPRLRDDYLLVKTTAVALNPSDWKHLDFLFGGDPTGTRMGCDYAGVVVEVGSKVTKPFEKGDRVAGVAHGSNQSQPEDGAFAEYIVVKGDLAIKIPDGVGDEEAATLGIGITTVGQGLYQSLKLPLPTEPLSTPEPILIYGGSTATGLLGVQFAKLSGYRVLTTASPRHFDGLRALGADAAFDYRSPTWAADVRAAAGGRLRLAWDCISSPDTARLCASALAEDEGGASYASLLPVPDDVVKGANAKASNSLTFAYTVFGEAFEKFKPFPAAPEDLEFGKMFWELSRGLLAAGVLKTASPIVDRGGGGLEGVLVGLRELKEGKVSGGKLVYRV